MAKKPTSKGDGRTKGKGSRKTPAAAAAGKTPSRSRPPARGAGPVNVREGATVDSATQAGDAGRAGLVRPPRNGTVGALHASPQNVPLSEEELRKVKTPLTKRDLENFRKLLMEKRAEIIGDVASLQTDTKNNGGNLSNMPLHMADVGTDNYDQEFTLGLVESERRLLAEIDEALIRLHNGTYGVCVISGKPIAKARLDAKPWAKHTIEVARDLEKRGRI